MKKKQTRLGALLVTLLMMVSLVGSFATTPVTVSAASKSELQAQLKALQEKEKQIKKKLSSAGSSLEDSKARKQLLDAQIENAANQINLLDSQLATANANMTRTNAEIAAAEVDIQKRENDITETHQKLGQRLRAIAKTGNVTAIQRLLNTDNYTDYLLKSKAAQCIADRDQKTMDDLEAALTRLRAQKETLEKKKTQIQKEQAEIKKLKAASSAKKQELDTLHAAARSELRKLQSNYNSYNDQLKETQRLIAAADAAITAMIQNSSSSGSYNQSMMYWPVPTVRAISSHFGPRWGTMHRGMDIANGRVPIYGQNIVAAADGVVIAANATSRYGTGWSYGYGYSCIIDHGTDSRGRKIHTLYAHCSVMNARVGQRVVGGQTVIGKAGDTGDVTGPHLHFEVRVDGVRVNPYPTYVHPNVN